jgi:hypothetical protein
VALYTSAGLDQYLRVDPAREVLGLRINVDSVLVLVGAVVYIVVPVRRRPGRETPEEPAWNQATAEPANDERRLLRRADG